FNALEKAAISLNPNIKIAKEELLKFTDKVFMTGSGSAYVGVFKSLEDARNFVDNLGDGFVFKSVAQTLDSGIEILAEN
ncbi:MAG: hypothetical protein K2J13_05665, partial [Clostridia bacterium]|nr:hypothetical protein [Clostridia bacterium]